MCGIIAAYCPNTSSNIEIVSNLLSQSKIRGQHSTGISFLDNDSNIITYKDNVPADKFIELYWDKFINDISELSHIKLIGHTRYSTSGLYAQPINTETSSIVLNGVITQEDASKWNNDFQLSDFKTDNDTEILLKMIEDGRDISEEHSKHKFSSSFCYMNKDTIIHMRTNDRPSHIYSNNDSVFLASTVEIMRRSKLDDKFIHKTEMGVLYDLINENNASMKIINFDKDLQV
jgi:glutamine phosphoribosylpyrophosphate amidotransferase